MKKRKQPPDKNRDFNNLPFRALKGMDGSVLAPVKKQEAEKKPPPPPPAEENDAELFFRAVSDVKPIEEGGKEITRHKPAKPSLPQSVVVDDEGKRVFLKAMETLDVKFTDEIPDDVVPLRQVGINRMRQLKKGAIRIDLELDLHGLTREEALRNLESFTTGAYNRGQKAVLVITGKGHNSPGEPVLQRAVMAWLGEKGKGMVAEFSPAPRSMGGAGAFVIFLRLKKEPAE